MKIKIRSMTYQDKPGIITMLSHMPEFKPSEVAVAEEVIDSYLKDQIGSGYNILVAELDSTIAGYICFGPTPLTEGTWDIYWIAVAPDKQRRGIGSALMDAAEKSITKSEGRLAIIETSSIPLYAGVRQFYNRRGYEIIASVPDFYTLGDDKIILRKRLK